MAPSFTGDPGKPEDPSKAIVGYCEPWSLRAGELIELKASSHIPGEAALRLVRLSCGDPTSTGPGFAEREVPSSLPARVDLDEQPIVPGSFATIDLDGLQAASKLALTFSVMATRPQEPQSIMAIAGDGFRVEVGLEDGVLVLRSGNASLDLIPRRRLSNRRWYDVAVNVHLDAGRLHATMTTEPSASPGRDLLEPIDTAAEGATQIPAGRVVALTSLEFAATAGNDGSLRGDFDGRIARPKLTVDDQHLWWDLGQDMAGRAMVDGTGQHRHGELHQLPTRAVTGPTWDGSEQRWTVDPSQWDAVHFHKGDLYDAGWATTASPRPTSRPGQRDLCVPPGSRRR